MTMFLVLIVLSRFHYLFHLHVSFTVGGPGIISSVSQMGTLGGSSRESRLCRGVRWPGSHPHSVTVEENK